MTVHIMFQYPFCVPSFISVHWLVFAVHLLTPKNDKKNFAPVLTPQISVGINRVESLYMNRPTRTGCIARHGQVIPQKLYINFPLWLFYSAVTIYINTLCPKKAATELCS